MKPEALSLFIASAKAECEFDGESTYGLRILAQNASVEFFLQLGKDFDRDQWIRDCGFER